ncbi:FH1/FH2 domain-containing protein 3, partial [Melipona quadrifasciata]
FQGDTGAYRSRANVGIAASAFGRTGSGLPSCRNNYSSSIGSGSSRVHGKERVSGFGNAFLKKDKEEKPTFKYSSKDTDKGRLHPSRSSTEDAGVKSPLSSSRSSLFEKYSFPATKTSERPASVLDRYNRAASREKSREPDGVSRYGSNTYPGSSLARTYGNESSRIEKKERADHPPVSYRGLRPNSGRSSREPSPEVNVGKSNSFRMYSRAPSYGRSSATSSASESSTAPISSRFGSTAGSRFLSPRSSSDRVPAAISYSGSDRFRTSGSKPTPANLKDDEIAKSNLEKKTAAETYSAAAKSEELKADNNRLQNNETVTMVTRGTSPSPPASSSFVRSRRADMGIANQREVTRVRKKTETKDQEVQSERPDDNSRFSRYGGGGRISGSPWSAYLDKFSSNSSGSGVYGRGFNGGAANPRVNSFAFSRSNDSTSKVSPSSSQEIHGTRIQNEQSTKVFGSLGFAAAKTDSKASASNEPGNSKKDQTEVKAQNSEIRFCANGGRTEGKTSRLASPSALKRDDSLPQQAGVGAKSPDSRESAPKSEEQRNSRESSISRSEDSGQKRPSIPRLGRVATKNETKITKSSSSLSTKSDGSRERRSSTPKSDTSSLSKLDECSRIVEGHCQEQNKEVSTSKSDGVSSAKDSFQSNSSHSRSTTPQSRSGSAKNLSRQATRTDSSDGSAVNVPIGRSKSSSASSVTSQGAKIKATPPPSPGRSSASCSSVSSVNLRQGGSPDARGKPPVPKSDAASANASKSVVPVKYVNKDFRKSTLNMENGDPSQSKYSRKKKSQRSVSASSQDSQSEPNSESNIHRSAIPSESSSSSVKSNRSRLRIPSSGTSSKSIGRKSETSGCSSRLVKSKSSSESPSEKKSRRDETSSSSGESESNSTNSSSSEEEEEEEEEEEKEEDDNKQTRPGSRRRKRRTSKSPFCEKKGKMSAGSSRTSVLASSTDEMSLTMEKPPRPPSSPRSRSDRERSGKTEEAKSFLMRALAPVTNLFKNKHQDSSESGKSGGWLDSNEESTDARKPEQNGGGTTTSLSRSLSKSFSFTNSEKNDDRRQSGARVRRNFSGEQPWWIDSNNDNVPEGVETGSLCNDEISQETTVSSTLPDDGKFKYKVWRQESEERAWWLDSNESGASEDTRKQQSSMASPVSKRESSRSSTRSNERRNRLRHQQSGEQPWWMNDNPENVPEGVEVFPVAATPTQNSNSYNDEVDDSQSYSRCTSNVRHIESGEKPWWMDSSSNVPDGVVKIPVETSNSTSDSSESFERIDIGVNPEPEIYAKRSLSRFPIEFPPPPPDEPLGDRASPEGVENPPDPPDNYGGRDSPYDNVQPTPRRSSPRKRPSTLPLFIGEHTNIDDLLGDTTTLCPTPVLSRIRKRERIGEVRSVIVYVDSAEDSSECEEIDATQVIIHDSTPQTPVIQRRHRELAHSKTPFIRTCEDSLYNWNAYIKPVTTGDAIVPSQGLCARRETSLCVAFFGSWGEKKGPIGQQSAVATEIQRGREMSLTCRVQYLNDVDPFAYASSYPEPPRPPVHTFSATLPLINQLAAVHRLLRAPHRVSSSFSLKERQAFLLIHRLSRGSRATAS